MKKTVNMNVDKMEKNTLFMLSASDIARHDPVCFSETMGVVVFSDWMFCFLSVSYVQVHSTSTYYENI